MKGFVVAIEGLIHAGKSTLIKELGRKNKEIKCVGEYVDFATSKFPGFPSNIKEANEARTYFIRLEEKRRETIDMDDSLIVLDRSVLSVLAYHFAVEKMTCGKIPCFAESIQSFANERWICPNLCIYLDIDDAGIKRRHLSESGKYDRILLDSKFNTQLRKFYEEFIPVAMPSVRIVRIDACCPLDSVLSKTEYFLGK